jgi:hypothetical protein
VNSNTLFPVVDDPELRDCAWLDSTHAMQVQLCVAGNDVYDKHCQRTCGSCTASSRHNEILEEVRSTFNKRPLIRKDPYNT